MTKPKICYRFVNENMTSNYDGETEWKLGEWKKVEGKLKCCSNGLHASLTPLQSLNNVYGSRWFIAEYRGKIVKEDNKFCASEMKLIKEIPIIVVKRFALFCAKDCLKYYEKEYPNDNRIAECIKTTEDYLDGKATIDEQSVAESAAQSAAESSESAWSAVWSARSVRSAESAVSAESASSAAWSAVWSAAWTAVWSARSVRSVRSAAKKRQEKELKRLIKEHAK